jgi:enamine deaminase RidA (YjgF/YER057c/UK114 family)
MGRSSLIRKSITSGYSFEYRYGYARAVRVGDHVFVSGTTARPPALEGVMLVEPWSSLSHKAFATGG